MTQEVWAAGDAYEGYMGRWSRRIAERYVRWLGVPPGLRWLDVGCGTGALTAEVLASADPGEVIGVDPSPAFIATAGERVTGDRAGFQAGDATDLPFPDGRFDVVVSGLMLNFVPVPARAAAEFRRVTRPGGTASAYVWDYAEGMGMLRHFWDAATALDPAAAELDEGRRRFPICLPDPLRTLWTGAGLEGVTVEPVVAPMVFASFDDYWLPFLGGQGPAGGYLLSLPDDRREALRDLLRENLPIGSDGTIELTTRAWAVRGTAPARSTDAVQATSS